MSTNFGSKPWTASLESNNILHDCIERGWRLSQNIDLRSTTECNILQVVNVCLACEIRDCSWRWAIDPRAVVRPFAYLRDPLFLLCGGLYALNRWALKPILNAHFLQFWFNDLLLIPCALPVVLWIQRSLHLRKRDLPPSFGEIAAHLIVWSVLFEAVGPHFFRRATGDWLDVVAYAAGALLGLVWWHRERFSQWFAP